MHYGTNRERYTPILPIQNRLRYQNGIISVGQQIRQKSRSTSRETGTEI